MALLRLVACIAIVLFNRCRWGQALQVGGVCRALHCIKYFSFLNIVLLLLRADL